ncbi:MAG: aminopeptidase P N-terminal domain-containing protein [Candidatus Aminicenantes bacterium]|jgi:Xaa-Pro aminopeptidase
MNKKILISMNIILLFLFTPPLIAGTWFEKSDHAERRARLMEKTSDGVTIILGATTPVSDKQFLQNSDFFYFTGVEIPNAVLVMDGMRKESTLFFTISEREARGEGISLELVRQPVEVTGIERVLPIERLSSTLSRLSLQTDVFYTMFRPEELSRENTNEKFRALQNTMTMNMWDGRLTRELQFLKRLKEKFPHITVKDCSPLVWDLRKIKSPAEIELLRQAAQIGVKAHIELIKATRPGVSEKELAALFEYVCKKEKAQELAFYVILMSGPNHAFGHYHKHDRILKSGDFIILDAGPEYGYYNADISSTFPANGKFSPEQKKIYEMSYGIRKTCLDNYRPGITFRDLGKKVREFLVKNGYDPEDRKFRGLIRYGGYNHSIGLATHDPMGTFAGPDEVLRPGFVFACDINIPYPDQEMGIRLEDTVVIKENGYENLSHGIPRTLAEIEALMKKK